MIVGVPKETKRDEYRVGLLPVGGRGTRLPVVSSQLSVISSWLGGRVGCRKLKTDN